MKLKRVLAASVAAVSLFGAMTVYGAYENGDFGHSYLYASYSGGMRRYSAATVRNNPSDAASLRVVTTYDDGSEYVYFSGVEYEDALQYSNWEWAEDYKSTHKYYASRNDMCYKKIEFSEN